MNYSLILAEANLGLVAAKFWGAEDFPIVNDGSTVHQTYTGDSSFDL